MCINVRYINIYIFTEGVADSVYILSLAKNYKIR